MNLCFRWIQNNLDLSMVHVDHLLKLKNLHKKLRKQEVIAIFIYLNKLDKVYFHHDMAQADF